MFRDTDAGDSAAKQGQNKMEQDVLKDAELKNAASKAAASRRAEGGAGQEPQLDFDRQDQAVQFKAAPRVKTDPSRDALLTAFGKATLTDRYLMPGESFQDLFARVASYYGDDEAHAQRLYDYISKLWFMPATPVLSNGGTDRGLPISCFLNEANDSLGDIVNLWNENVWLASRGGGIGSLLGQFAFNRRKASAKTARPPVLFRSSA